MAEKITNKYLEAQIEALKKSENHHRNNNKPGRRRFWMYGYLRDVYRVFRVLQTQGVAKKAARRIVKQLELPIKIKSHLLRVLIEASAGAEDNRTKIKWASALRYAFGWLQQPEKLEWFFDVNGGIAGSAAKFSALRKARRQKKSQTTPASSEPPSAQSASVLPRLEAASGTDKV